MVSVSVDHARLAALSYELDDGLALLTAGRENLRRMRPASAGVVMALLASGVEKLLKLTLGLMETDEGGSWPDQKTMQGTWRHRIAALDDHVLARLEARSDLSNAKPYIELVLRSVAADPLRREMFATLEAYARAGRFANLDTLSGSNPAAPSPWQRWEAMTTSIAQADPQLLERLVDPTEDYAACLSELAGPLDESLHSWQHALYRAWQHGLAGPEARRWSSQLHVSEPPGLTLP